VTCLNELRQKANGQGQICDHQQVKFPSNNAGSRTGGLHSAHPWVQDLLALETEGCRALPLTHVSQLPFGCSFQLSRALHLPLEAKSHKKKDIG